MHGGPYGAYLYDKHERVEIVGGQFKGAFGTVEMIYTGSTGRQQTVVVKGTDEEVGKFRVHKMPSNVRPASREDRIQHGVDLINAGVEILEAEGVGVEIQRS